MLNSQDIKLIEKSFDKKLKPIQTDIAAIQRRVAEMEESQISHLDFMQMRATMRDIERRMAALEGKLAKTASKDDLKPIKSKLNRISRDLKSTTRFFDTEVVDLDKRTDRIEKHLKLPSFSSAS